MKNLRLQGHTLEEIATAFGVTKEWVRKSILKVSEEGDQERFARALARRRAVRYLARAHSYRDMLRVASKAGTTPLELFQSNDLDLQLLMDARHRYVRGLLNRSGTQQTFSNEDILDALRSAAERADTDSLSSSSYNKHRTEGDPSSQLVTGRFASWNEAIREAGLKPIPGPHGDSPHQTWSRSVIVDSVTEFFRERGWDKSLYTYDEWVGDRKRPSAAVVVSRLGGWANARLEALPILLGEGPVHVAGEFWELDDFPSEVLEKAGV